MLFRSEVFRISKVGAIAGCYVQDGMIKRNSKVRVLRANVIIHTGDQRTQLERSIQYCKSIGLGRKS